jgi:hypothetical protein
MSQIKADFSGALHKTAVMVRLPKATKHVLTQWATDTVMMLKKSAAAMQKSGPGRKTGLLARNIGMQATPSEDLYKILIGTGVGGTQSVKYASIQDQGGVIKAKKKYLTIPLGSTKGLIRNFPGGFFFKSAAGNVLYALRVGSKRNPKIKPLFLLREQVTLPATHWFSGITDARAKDLAEAMKQGNILKVAEGMAAGANV